MQIDRNIRFEARDIIAKYQPYLVMGADQALEFQSTVARFLVKKRAVERDDNLSPKAKYPVGKTHIKSGNLGNVEWNHTTGKSM